MSWFVKMKGSFGLIGDTGNQQNNGITKEKQS